MSPTRTITLTTLAMLAFAANSLLCRAALGGDPGEAAAFTALRLLSGAVTLAAILNLSQRGRGVGRPDWWSTLALFVYAACFSFAYLSLSAGTGALILFGAVQLTMIIAGLAAGERLSRAGWVGFAAACGGMTYLLSPGLEAPSVEGALLMGAAGIAWGMYSLRGRRAAKALQATTANFVYAVPLGLLVVLPFVGEIQLSASLVKLAVASGALASGLGYVLWYQALCGLTVTQASTVQLSVPVIAAVAAVPLLAEPVTLRLVIASIVVLGGVAVVINRGRSAAT